jgi:hypothetical protein
VLKVTLQQLFVMAMQEQAKAGASGCGKAPEPSVVGPAVSGRVPAVEN